MSPYWGGGGRFLGRFVSKKNQHDVAGSHRERVVCEDWWRSSLVHSAAESSSWAAKLFFFSRLSFVTFMKPGAGPSSDLAGAASMKLEFPGLRRSSISTSSHPIILQS